MNDRIAHNNLLKALSPQDRQMMAAFLQEKEFAVGTTLHVPGDHVKTVYFPCGPAMAAYFVGLPDGKGVETALVGHEGAIGGIVSQGRLPAYARCTVQYAGTFLLMSSSELEELKLRSITIRHLFARYADCLMAQIFQTTACNAGHTINQRAAKWMLSTIERSGTTTIAMTQDQLADMLGVGRSYISRVIAAMKSAGLIRTSRKRLEVANLDLVRAMSCDCNDSVKRHYDRVLRGIYPNDEIEQD